MKEKIAFQRIETDYPCNLLSGETIIENGAWLREMQVLNRFL
jgi:hypothetical protein